MSAPSDDEWKAPLLALQGLFARSMPPAWALKEYTELLQRVRPSAILKRTRSLDSSNPPAPVSIFKQPKVASALEADSGSVKADSVSEEEIHRDVKFATVRIGLYDRVFNCFFQFGSGALVSHKGHILSAAHLFVGPLPPEGGWVAGAPLPFSQMYSDAAGVPRFQGRSVDKNLIICIGMYEADEKPCRWMYKATLLTPPELLKARHEGDRLLDLAVLQITGNLQMDPQTFQPTRKCPDYYYDRYLVTSEGPHQVKVGELPAVLPLGNPDDVASMQARLAVAGWPSPTDEYVQYCDKTVRAVIAKE